MTCTAPGTVIVISRIGSPAAVIASTARMASFSEDARTTGITPASRIRGRTSDLFITEFIKHYTHNWGEHVSEPRADRGPHAGSPRGVVDATGSRNRVGCKIRSLPLWF